MKQRIPLGVYDHEAPEEVPGLYSVGVGDSFPAKLARDATSLVNRLDQKLNDLIPLP